DIGSFRIWTLQSTFSCLDQRYWWIKFGKTYTAQSFDGVLLDKQFEVVGGLALEFRIGPRE
ncbi:12883_t:CDS:2, partial [Gigaspora rosea]